MGRPAFLTFKRPFAKETVDNYPGVLVPLAQSKRHQSVMTRYASRSTSSTEKTSISGKKSDEDAEPGVLRRSSLDSNYDPYTIEGLTWEIETEAGASGHDTVYDRKRSDSKCEHLLTFCRKVKGHKLCYPRYRNGPLQLGALRTMWFRLVCRQPMASSTLSRCLCKIDTNLSRESP